MVEKRGGKVMILLNMRKIVLTDIDTIDAAIAVSAAHMERVKSSDEGIKSSTDQQKKDPQ